MSAKGKFNVKGINFDIRNISMRTSFNFLAPINLRNRNQLKAFIKQIFATEGTIGNSVDVIFCSDSYLLNINSSFLKHDFFTDIITFNLADKNAAVHGEIYISVDTVKTNAVRFNNTVDKELHRVIFHGILHLCGYTDKTAKQQTLMTAKEDYYLALYFDVPRGA